MAQQPHATARKPGIVHRLGFLDLWSGPRLMATDKVEKQATEHLTRSRSGVEHVRGDRPGMARVQRALDATVWPLLVGGCHVGRDIAAAVAAAGFEGARIESFRFPPGSGAPTAPHVKGTARRT